MLKNHKDIIQVYKFTGPVNKAPEAAGKQALT